MESKAYQHSITFRPATSSDAAFILELEKITMREYVEALWGEWKPSSTVEQLSSKGHQIILCDERPVGCFAVTEDGDFLTVKKLYLEPGSQNKGIGAKALQKITSEAEMKGLRAALSVLTTNPAKRFYEREGFVVVSQTKERIRMERTKRVGREPTLNPL